MEDKDFKMKAHKEKYDRDMDDILKLLDESETCKERNEVLHKECVMLNQDNETIQNELIRIKQD